MGRVRGSTSTTMLCARCCELWEEPSSRARGSKKKKDGHPFGAYLPTKETYLVPCIIVMKNKYGV